MVRDPRFNHRIRSILVMLATVATIAFYSMASSGNVGGRSAAEILDAYPTVFSLAGYALSIWSLIFLGLAVFSIYQVLPVNLSRYGSIRTPYIASCVLACAWIYSWHHQRMGSAVILALGLTATLLYIASRFRTTVKPMETWAVKGTFGLYSGWVTVMGIVDLFMWFASFGSAAATSTLFAILAVVVLTGAAVMVTWRISNHFFPFAIAWGLTAVAVKQSSNTAIVAAGAICVIICLVAALSFVLTLPSRTPTNKDDE